MASDGPYCGQRLLDIGGAAIGLLLLAPLLGLIALLIKCESSGSVWYKGVRLGRHGAPFRMLKFRTMIPDAETTGLLATPEGDSRVTTVGRWLRKYKLDELPQLVNVLRGEMSLVGPRPEAPFYFQYYTEEEKRIILSVRPGMTDYGSLRFHDEGTLLAGSGDPVKTYVEKIRDEKVRAQIRYIRDRCLVVDLKLIVATVATIVATRLWSDPGPSSLRERHQPLGSRRR
jgi:lipopolysaccharide/colanic/teichoic acid biosynthesis glycosyltransferase